MSGSNVMASVSSPSTSTPTTPAAASSPATSSAPAPLTKSPSNTDMAVASASTPKPMATLKVESQTSKRSSASELLRDIEKMSVAANQGKGGSTPSGGAPSYSSSSSKYEFSVAAQDVSAPPTFGKNTVTTFSTGCLSSVEPEQAQVC